MIVIDVGCARYGGTFSIEYLAEDLKPRIIYGFDPNQGAKDYPGGPPQIEGTEVVIEKKAAWVHDGEVLFAGESLGGHIDPGGSRWVKCFDLSDFIRSLPSDEEIVLKLDCEGAEYELLEHLIMLRTDELLKAAWVEWHSSSNAKHKRELAARRQTITKTIQCDLWEWTL